MEEEPQNYEGPVETPSPEQLAECKEQVMKAFSKKQVLKAIKALLQRYQVEKSKTKSKKELFAEEEEEMDERNEIDFERFPIERNAKRSFYLVFSLNKLSSKFTHTLKGRRIDVPHPFEKASQELDICLITTENDEEKLKTLIKTVNDNSALSEREKSTLLSVKRILTRQKVLKIYPSPKKKKDLSMLHDVFLVDTRLAAAMPQTLGKYFLKGSKQFKSVRLIPKDFKFIPDYLPRSESSRPVVTESLQEIAENIEETIEGIYFYPRGSCATLRVGRMGMKEKHLYSNIVKVVAGVSAWLQESGGFNCVLSVSLKTGDSIALPLYSTVPDLETLDKDDTVKDDDKLAKIMLKRKALQKERKRKRRRLKP